MATVSPQWGDAHVRLAGFRTLVQYLADEFDTGAFAGATWDPQLPTAPTSYQGPGSNPTDGAWYNYDLTSDDLPPEAPWLIVTTGTASTVEALDTATRLVAVPLIGWYRTKVSDATSARTARQIALDRANTMARAMEHVWLSYLPQWARTLSPADAFGIYSIEPSEHPVSAEQLHQGQGMRARFVDAAVQVTVFQHRTDPARTS